MQKINWIKSDEIKSVMYKALQEGGHKKSAPHSVLFMKKIV